MKTKRTLYGMLMLTFAALLFGTGYLVGVRNSPMGQMQLENSTLHLDVVQAQHELESLQQRHDEFLKVGGQYLAHSVRLTSLLEESLAQNRDYLGVLEGVQPAGNFDYEEMRANIDGLEKAKQEIEKQSVLLGIRSHQQKDAQKMFEREEEILRQGIKEADSL